LNSFSPQISFVTTYGLSLTTFNAVLRIGTWSDVSLLNPVYTMQPVVQPVVQLVRRPVGQPAVSCKRGFRAPTTRLSTTNGSATTTAFNALNFHATESSCYY